MSNWRYIAQRIPSGEFVEWNVPLADVEVTTALSGPGRLTGTIPVELARMKAADGRPLLDEWGTAIWAEEEGHIRGGGILVQSDFDEKGRWRLDCMGYSGYPQGMPYTGPEQSWVHQDPFEIVRFIWNHLQSEKNGNLGVLVDKHGSPLRVGEPTDDMTGESGNGISDGPYKLNWWETSDLGAKVDELARSGPFDYKEEDYWDGDQIVHRLRLFYPRIGRRRTDLRFVVGENVTPPEVLRGGADYADEVLILGAGEGRDQVRAHLARKGNRIRRVALLQRKGITSSKLAQDEARAELSYRQGFEAVDQIEVTDHPHAPVGSYRVGDEILLQGRTGWFDLSMWVRIVELTIRPEDKSNALLTVIRSEVA